MSIHTINRYTRVVHLRNRTTFTSVTTIRKNEMHHAPFSLILIVTVRYERARSFHSLPFLSHSLHSCLGMKDVRSE